MNKQEIIEISSNNNLKSSNFGGGIELLMNNDKKKETSYSKNVDFEDLNNLEKELNELSFNNDDENNNYKKKDTGFFESDLFNVNEDHKISFDDFKLNDDNNDNDDNKYSNIGKSTANYQDDNISWDGFQKMGNNVPINPDKTTQNQMTKEELLREKFKFIRKLEELENKGIKLSKKYNMESSLAEMQGEYETIIDEKNKSNSIKFQANMMLAFVNGIEFLNNKFDPFDIKIDGLSDQISENINDYDDVFGELYEKYKTKASIAPELKLLFQLGGSAMMIHMTNTMFKSSMPSMDDIFKQNPDLMRSFQQATVNSMSNSSPGLSNFMDGVLNDSNRRGPPPPIQTQYTNEQYDKTLPNYSNRGGNNPYGQLNSFPSKNETSQQNKRPNTSSNTTSFIQSRTEMKGPSDIDELLGKLKTKTINITEQNYENLQQNSQKVEDISSYTNNSSTISINDLKELSGNIKLPKKSGRKRSGSDKNISSMNIDL